MNDKLKNLSIEPDPQVWQGISRSLRRKAIAKYSSIAAAVVAAVAGAALLWPTTGSVAEAPDQPVQIAGTEMTVSPIQYVENNNVKAATLNNETYATSVMSDAKAPEQLREADVETEPEYGMEPSGTPYVDRYVGETKVAAEKKSLESQKTAGSETKAAPQEPAKAKASTSEGGVKVHAPNAFTPDGDVAANRIFRVYPSETVSNFKMYIYDRSGHNVFESRSVGDGWDGTYNGQKLPQAAYVYVVSFTTNDGKNQVEKGSVVLIR